MPVASLPADVWVYIAQFIPKDDLRSMLNVNGTFFQLAMDARYADANFCDFSDAGLKRMQRLKNPSISHRVRYLRVDLDFGRESDDDDDERNLKNSLALDTPWEEVIQSMAYTVACMTNIVEFQIQWSYCLPSGEQLSLFLTAAWEAFGSNVREVNLMVSLENLPVLLSTAEGIIGPKDLGIGILADVPEEQKDGTALATVLAPFINKISTLRGFSLSSGPDLQVSPLFHQLSNIPNLERLSLLDDCGAYVSELLGLTRFLRNHAATLRHINYVDNYGYESPPQPMEGWMAEDELDGAVFFNLLSLEFSVSKKRAVFRVVLQLIRCSAGTLMSLVLGDYCLSADDMNALLSAFAPHQTGHFRELELWVDCVSPELIYRLSKTLPRLEKLSLDVTYLAAWNGTGRKDLLREDGPWDALLANYANNLRKYDFRDWPLRDISIGTNFPSYAFPEFKLAMNIAQTVAECVPSVRKINGKTRV